MDFSQLISYMISQLTVIGQALVVIVKVIINVAVVSFEFIAKLLKLASNQ